MSPALNATPVAVTAAAVPAVTDGAVAETTLVPAGTAPPASLTGVPQGAVNLPATEDTVADPLVVVPVALPPVTEAITAPAGTPAPTMRPPTATPAIDENAATFGLPAAKFPVTGVAKNTPATSAASMMTTGWPASAELKVKALPEIEYWPRPWRAADLGQRLAGRPGARALVPDDADASRHTSRSMRSWRQCRSPPPG